MIDIEKMIQKSDYSPKKYQGKIIAFVHAKGNSARVPSKNLRILGDRPLFCHAITNARGSSLVDEVIIDSDSDEILKIGKEYGAIPLKRPKELASNLATGDDLAYWQALNAPCSKIVLQVIPTAPFLSSESIDKAIRILLDHPEIDSVAGVYGEALYTWSDGKPDYYKADGSIPNSFEMKKIIYETTGLYVNDTRAVLKNQKRLNAEKCMACVVSRIEAVDINTMEDFEFAQIIWEGRKHLPEITGGGYSLLILFLLFAYQTMQREGVVR